MIIYETGQIHCCCSNSWERHHTSINHSFWFWGKGKPNLMQTCPCVPASLSPLYSPVSVPFLDHQTQEPRWLVNELSISKTVLFVSFLLQSPPYACLLLCVALKVLWRKAQMGWRQNAALWWDELVRVVFACDQHWGLLERNVLNTLLLPVVILHCLTLSIFTKTTRGFGSV